MMKRREIDRKSRYTIFMKSVHFLSEKWNTKINIEWDFYRPKDLRNVRILVSFYYSKFVYLLNKFFYGKA